MKVHSYDDEEDEEHEEIEEEQIQDYSYDYDEEDEEEKDSVEVENSSIAVPIVERQQLHQVQKINITLNDGKVVDCLVFDVKRDDNQHYNSCSQVANHQ